MPVPRSGATKRIAVMDPSTDVGEIQLVDFGDAWQETKPCANSPQTSEDSIWELNFPHQSSL
jgi:hypothetical protein